MRLLFFLLCGLCLSFAKKRTSPPPGTVLLNSGLYMDQTEITNFNWMEYVHWIKQNHGENTPAYQQALPDSTVWSGGAKVMRQFYFTHPAYRDYPVVGISYAQAETYCAWRSERVNLMLYLREKKQAYHADSTYSDVPQRYTYRLPTKVEWLAAASKAYTIKTQRKLDRKYKTNEKYNFHVEQDEQHPVSVSMMTCPVSAYWPNEFKLYNLYGNVSEMVEEKGTVMGGSWKDNQVEVFANPTSFVQSPNNWVGFRCVCEENKYLE